ncbi:MAG: DUF1580 domain-containing protein [Pirellulales bacterium]|nr:DUF1580 domain-containing protein [Pirellulales bacterium]
MADIFNVDDRLTLSQAAHLAGVAPATIWRWTTRGVRGVVLESYKLGAKKFTTRSALNEFSRALSGATGSASPKPNQRHVAAHNQAKQQLVEAGAA